MRLVCLDASFVLVQLLREDLSVHADALVDSWRSAETQLIAPPLLKIEVPSALRQAIHRGRVSSEDGEDAFHAFLALPVQIEEPKDLLMQAWVLGRTLDAPRLYDMYYVALAEIKECELWTADRRLVNITTAHLPFVRWVGDSA